MGCRLKIVSSHMKKSIVARKGAAPLDTPGCLEDLAIGQGLVNRLAYSFRLACGMKKFLELGELVGIESQGFFDDSVRMHRHCWHTPYVSLAVHPT